MTRPFIFTLIAISIACAGFSAWAWNASLPPPSDAYLDIPAKPLIIPAKAQVAFFAGGCFWGTEETFRTMNGVLGTQTGYAGGTGDNPTYKTIHGKENTGYVETVEIVYDPTKVTYAHLLKTFFANHDPTVPHPGTNHAIGKAYRSFVFYSDDSQAKKAKATIHTLNTSRRYAFPIATQVRPATRFFPAEARHQQYYAKKGEIAKCQP